ncbi:hypothetical protein [Streptomyces sp. NPDC002602]|uniref:hypothetical protein n=1 Tax=Streptomyces sp. NPDC002602 TaxID=3364654 RepID=UPI0036AFC1FC
MVLLEPCPQWPMVSWKSTNVGDGLVRITDSDKDPWCLTASGEDDSVPVLPCQEDSPAVWRIEKTEEGVLIFGREGEPLSDDGVLRSMRTENSTNVAWRFEPVTATPEEPTEE